MASEYTPQPEVIYPPPSATNKQGVAGAALVLGILNLVSWCLPICGFPMSIAGIITGVIGLKSSSRGLAIAGIVLSSIGLILSVINAIAGIFLFTQSGFNWQGFDFQDLMP